MENCIFCKILRNEIPSSTVYEDDKFRAIMDIGPVAKGHVILLAKEHAANLLEADDELLAAAMPAAKKVANAVKKTVGCDGINILRLNRCRCAARQAELMAVHAFSDREGNCTRPDIIKAINRLSSYLYLLMMVEKAKSR